MKVTISLPEDLAEKTQAYCEDQGFKVSTLIQHLLKSKIDFITEFPKTRPLVSNSPKEDKPSLSELKKVMQETEQKYSPHDFGPSGVGICFKCGIPHKKDVVK